MHTYLVLETVGTLDVFDRNIFLTARIQDCPAYVLKSRMSSEELREYFSDQKFILLDPQQFISGEVIIVGFKEAITTAIHSMRELNPRNEDDIDEIFSIINEFGYDWLNFEQKDVLERYSNIIARS